MPIKGYKCNAPGRYGKSCSPAECKQRCLDNEGCAVASYMSVLQYNMAQYNNRGSISGSQLVKPCDGMSILTRLLDYDIDPRNSHANNFRGSNGHDTFEKVCKDDPDLKDWLFEVRFFAALTPDDEIIPLQFIHDHIHELSDGSEDWDEAMTIFHYLESLGWIILSGQIDAYDGKNGALIDIKTQSKVWNQAKDEWIAQLNFYRLLMVLYGYVVREIKVNAMDSSQQLTIHVPLVLMDDWIEGFLIPRIRELDVLSKIDHVDDAWDHCVPGFLCNQNNRRKWVWCPVADQCVVRQDELGDLVPWGEPPA